MNTPNSPENSSNKHLFLLIISLVVVLAIIFAVSAYYSSSGASKDSSQKTQSQEVQDKGTSTSNNEKGTSSVEKVTSLEGIVRSVDLEKKVITIEFNYKGDTWNSKVKIDEDTRLGGFNQDDESLPPNVSLSDFDEGEKVIVNTSNNFLEKSTFKADFIVKTNKTKK